MNHHEMKDLFSSSVEHVTSHISQYSVQPDTNFLRNIKLSPQTLIPFLVSQGSSSTRGEMLDFLGLDASIPTF